MFHSRTSNDIDMKFGTISTPEKRNTANLKTLEDGFMLANCNAIIIFLTYDQFGATRKPDFASMVSKTYIFINRNF